MHDISRGVSPQNTSLHSTSGNASSKISRDNSNDKSRDTSLDFSSSLTQNTKDTSVASLLKYDKDFSLNGLQLANALSLRDTESGDAIQESSALQSTDSANSNVTESSEDTNIRAINLGTIRTSATFLNSDIDKDLSKNVIVITKEEIQNKGYANIEQALEQQPFVNFVDSGFGRNIDLRGQGKDSNRAVKVLVNGVPINSLDTISGVASFNNLNLEDVEGIEILPGGSSVVYGSGSRGGVVNIITKKNDKDYLKVSLKGSSAEALGLQGGGISINGGKKLGDRFFIYGSLGAGYIPGTRNTNIKPPAQVAFYKKNNSTNCPSYIPQGLPSNTAQLWNPECNDTGERNTYTYLPYHDNNIQFTASFGLNYDITQYQRLEFSTNYALNIMKKIPSYLDAKDFYCIPNQAYDATTNNSVTPYLCNYDTTNPSVSTHEGMNLYTDPREATLRAFRYSIDKNFVGMNVHTMNSALKYSLEMPSISSSFDAIAYHNMNLIDYTNYWRDGTLPSMYSDMGGSYFHNHNGGLNLKFKNEFGVNMLVLGLDNAIGYAKRSMKLDSVIADLSSLSPQYGEVAVKTSADNTAFKTSVSPYIYDKLSPTSWFDISAGARYEYSFYRVTNNQGLDYRGLEDATLSGFFSDITSFNPESTAFDIRTNRHIWAAEISPEFKYHYYSGHNGSVFMRGEYGYISPSPFQMIDADPENEINQGGSGSNGFGNNIRLIRNSYNNLKSERYLTGEVGLKESFTFENFYVNGLYLSIVGYYTHTFDEIFLNQSSGSLSFLYRNIGQTQRAGGEILSRQAFLGNRLRFNESVGYVWTNIYRADRDLMASYAANTSVADFALEGSKVPFVPDWKITLKIEGDILKSARHILTGIVQGSYTGESYSLFISSGKNPTNSTSAYAKSADEIYSIMNKGGYFLLDLGLSYHFKGGQWNNWIISAGARNVLDTFYKTYQSRYYYYPAMGRSYYIELKWQF